MTRRVALSVVAAVVLLLTCAGTASANGVERFGWVLQLRNTADAKALKENLDYRAFRALRMANGNRFERSWVDDMKTPEDPADDVTYKGLTLRRLVARIDDRNPATFSRARAAKGYDVLVESMDGFAAVFTSEEILTIGARIIVADLANGAPLVVPAAELKAGDPPTASWKPLWPLKVVSGDPAITGKRKPGGALRISIVPPMPK